MVKKIKKREKLNRQTTHFLNLVKKSYDKKQIFSALKYEMNIESADKIVKDLMTKKGLRENLINTPFPLKYEDIGFDRPLKYKENSLDDIYWTANLLQYFIDEINNFLYLKKKFELFFLKGMYEKSQEILDNIKNEYGVSNWLISTTMLLLEEQKGIKEQKKFSQEIKENNKISPFTRVLTNYNSMKIEKNMSYSKYEKTLEEIMGSDISEIRKKHYALNLGYYLNSKTIEENDISALIFYDNHSTIIDMYLNFQLLIENNFLYVEDLEIKKAINYSLETLFSNIENSSIWEWSNFVIGNSIVSKKNKEFLNLLDSYSLGNYFETVQKCLFLLEENLPNFEVFEILVKSYINLEEKENIFVENSFLYKFLINFKKLIRKENGVNEAYLELKKYMNICQNFNWARQFYYFIIKSFNPSVNYLLNQEKSINSINFFPSIPYNPISLFFLKEKELYWKLIENIELNQPKSVSYLLNKALLNNDIYSLPKLEDARLNKYKAQIFFNKKNYNKAIEIFKKGYLSEKNTLKIDNLTGLINSYLNNKNHLKCLKLIASTYLKNQNIYPIYPFKDIYQEIQGIYDDKFNSEIVVPIFYDIYSKHHDLEGKIELKDTFEDFLEAHGLEKASEIKSKINDFDKSNLIYFLKNICTFDVMETYTAFSNTSEVQLEIISICQLLSILDEKNILEYSKKIEEITQALHMKSALREIEQSKIYVDVNGIKDVVESTLKDSYNRYKELESELSQEFRDNQIILNFNDTEHKEENHQILINSNEEYNLLKNIYEEIRDYFVLSPNYGLDGYLSTGIRHGTLASQIRKPLECYNLITQKERITDTEYKKNYHWADIYIDLSDEDLKTLIQALNDFSKSIDLSIEVLNKQLIQIKTEKTVSNGLFDYTINENLILNLRKKVKKTESYNEFIEIIIKKLWEITDNNLGTIRYIIDNMLKVTFYDKFEKLKKDLKDLAVNQLKNNIYQAQTELTNQLDSVSSWFTRNEAKLILSYTLDYPIDMAEKTVNNLNPSKKISVNKIIDQKIWFSEGESLKSYVDIFVIIFDNITKYSKVNSYPINVDVTCKRKENELFLTFKNYNDLSLNQVELKKKLDGILKEIKNLNYLSKVNGEGGTGLCKIAKILKTDLKWKFDLNYNMNEEWFAVIIKIDLEGKYEDINS